MTNDQLKRLLLEEAAKLHNRKASLRLTMVINQDLTVLLLCRAFYFDDEDEMQRRLVAQSVLSLLLHGFNTGMAVGLRGGEE